MGVGNTMDTFKYKALIFDVGDTLLARRPSNAEILMERCWKIGVFIEIQQAIIACKRSELWIGEQIMRELNGSPRMPDDEFNTNVDYIALKEVCLDKHEAEIKNIVQKLQTIRGENQECTVIDVVYETLSTLKSKGFILAIVSNFNRSLSDMLKRFDLIRYFDDITVSSVVNVEKPNPAILYHSCKNINMKPEDCLYVGDHPFDIMCAKKANMDIAWICNDNDSVPSSIPYKEDYRITSVKELVNLINNKDRFREKIVNS